MALLKEFVKEEVGEVYQNFGCKGRTYGGTVESIVRWSVPGLLQVCGSYMILSVFMSGLFLILCFYWFTNPISGLVLEA